MDVDQLVTARHDTNVTPNTGGTFGSSSIAIAGPRLRSAAATARQALLGLASERLGVPAAALTVARGVVSRRRQVRDVRRARRRPAAQRADGRARASSRARRPSKPVASYRLVGRARTPRVDIPAKVDRRLHLPPEHPRARDAARPDRAAARPGRLRAGTENGIVVGRRALDRGIGDARVVRRGDFLGVVASREFDAIEAAARLKVVYRDPPAISGSGNLWREMRELDAAGQAPARDPVRRRRRRRGARPAAAHR